MQLFTNATQTRFFSTNAHVRDLHPIEINSVADLMTKLPDIKINLLISNFFFEPDEFGELIIKTDDGYHPTMPFVFDFLEPLTFCEITAQAIDVYEYSDIAGLVRQIKHLWQHASVLREGVEEFLFVASDASKLVLTLNHFSHTVEAKSFLFSEEPITKLIATCS